MRKVAKRPVVRHDRFQNLELDIEFPRGAKRPFRDDAGKQQFKTMLADYGEVKGTEGLDGDPVDVYVGPDKKSDKVFVVTQMTKGDWAKVDEEKCILGVRTQAEAKKLYLSHYNDSRFCGAIKELSMSAFQKKLAKQGAVGEKISSNAARIAEINFLRMQNGDAILRSSGIKLATDALRPVAARADDGVLGDDPDLHSMPGLTLFGKAQPEQKVAATSMEQRWHNLKLRRDPNYKGDKALQRVEAAFPSPTRTRDPVHVADQRHAEVGETEVTQLEQRGLGIKQPASDPSSSAMRKAAAAVKKARSKLADAGRLGRIADRVDDVGIGMLAAPYAASSVGSAMAKAPGRIGAAGKVLHGFAENKMRSSHALELGGLALVAPGITHRVAKGIDKRLPCEKTAAGPFALQQRSQPPQSFNSAYPMPTAPARGNTVGYSQRPGSNTPSFRAPAPGQELSGIQSLAPGAATLPGGARMTPASMVAPTMHVPSATPTNAELMTGGNIPKAPRLPAEAVAANQAVTARPSSAAAARSTVQPAGIPSAAPTVAPGRGEAFAQRMAAPRGATVAPPPQSAGQAFAGRMGRATPASMVPPSQAVVGAGKAALPAAAETAAAAAAKPGLLARLAPGAKALGRGAMRLGKGGLGLGVGALGLGALGLGAGAAATAHMLKGEPQTMAPGGYQPPRMY
jgi:hypothetical protein